jgi:PPP family 3-phenylpropionic acid transporter
MTTNAPTPGRLSLALRLSFFYAAVFGTVGVSTPFFPVWLSSRGMDAAQIGILLAAVSWVRVVTTPWLGGMAERMGERRRPMAVLAAVALAAFASYGLVGGFWGYLCVGIVAGVAHAAVMPLGENVTMSTAPTARLDYGHLRLWGSFAFILASAGGGWFLKGRPADVILWLLVGTATLMFLACCLLPEPHLPRAHAHTTPVRRLLGNRLFLLFVFSCGLLQASHAVVYGFGTLHWRAAGLDDATIGWLWAEGVLAEIVLFALGARVMGRLGPLRLLLLAGGAGVVRWLITAVTANLDVLIAVQLLHGFTFGGAHLGAMYFIQRAAPPGLSASAQSLYSAVGTGVVMGLALLLAGPLYGAFGGGAFAVMALFSAGGMVGVLMLGRRWKGDAFAA